MIPLTPTDMKTQDRIQWSDATTFSGLYFVRLEHSTGTVSRKLVLIR